MVPKSIIKSTLIAFVLAVLFLPASAQTNVTPTEARAIAKDAYIYGFSVVDSYRVQHAYCVDRDHPEFKMIGAFDKTVMHLGEAAVRAEFERLLPTMAGGGFIVSVDHQTPPGVSLQQYRDYVELLGEYCMKAAQ